MKMLLIGTLALIASLAGTADAYQQYVVNTKEINVRTRPIDGHVLGTLRQGDEVTVYGTRAGWALLSQPGVPEQWVNLSLLTGKGSGGAQAQSADSMPQAPKSSSQGSVSRMSQPSAPEPAARQPSRSLSGPLTTSSVPAPMSAEPMASTSAMPAEPAPRKPAKTAMAKPKPAAARPAPSRTPMNSQAQYSSQPQIASNAFVEASRHFSKHDVDILRRGAAQMLEMGRCQHVDFAYKSTINPDEYYVYCGNNRRVIFTEADLTQ